METKLDMKVTDNGDNKYTVTIDEVSSSKLTSLCIWLPIILLVVLAVIATTIFLCLYNCAKMQYCWYRFCGNAKICNLVIVFIIIAFTLSVTVIALIFTTKSVNLFAKMAFLKGIINQAMYFECIKSYNSQGKDSDNKELTKKFCDTLAEL